MIAVLTGVTGKSGRYAIERLMERADELADSRIRVIVRSEERAAFLRESGLPIDLYVGSVDDEAFLLGAMDGADTLLHIVGIHTSRRVIGCAVRAGIRRVIAVHTTGVYSKYKSAGAEYARIDADVARLCADAGVQLSILRPTMIYGGPDDENVLQVHLNDGPSPVMPVVSGRALRPAARVHRRDLGRAYADVLLSRETVGRDYVLGKEPIDLREMLTVTGYLGKPARFISMPYPIAIAGAWALYLATLTKLDYREKVQRLVEPRAYPHDDATRDFGYAPMGFAEGVRGEVEAYLASTGRAGARVILDKGKGPS